jgi:hypothetical protein
MSVSALIFFLIIGCIGGLVGLLGWLPRALLERRAGNETVERREQLARARAARAARSQGRGTLLVAAGILVWPVGLMVGALLKGVIPGGGNVPPALLATAAASMVLLRYSRRMRAKGAEQVLENDPRPPIVYLRSFDFDRTSSATATSGLLPTETKTYEQRVARALRRVAPVVAVGDPTEELPELGSVRLYADDAEWQRTIEDLTGRGGTIILHIGDSEGLAWEVSHVVGLGQPERIVLSLGVGYTDFRRKFGHIFPRGLPQIPRSEFLYLALPRISKSEFLYFDADWTPRVFDRRASRTVDAPLGSPGEQRAMTLRRLDFELRVKPKSVNMAFLGFFLLITLGLYLFATYKLGLLIPRRAR